MPILAPMGWQDRDWAKWSDDERDRFYATRTGGTSSGRLWAFDARRRLLLAVLVSATITAAAWQWHLLALPLPGRTSTSNIVHLRDKTGIDVPATNPTTWAISDPRFGGFAVTVQIGETPRHALTMALAARGYTLAP